MKSSTFLLFSCLIAAALQAQVIHVPADYPSIQLGINAANPGDTVLVSDGTYFEQINFLGKKPLMVASQFLMDGDTNHITSTIINGSQLPNPDSASVVYFISGEDSTSILCGFTITGGRGTANYSPIWFWSRAGGGIWISGSGAKIRNNIITRNRCEDFNVAHDTTAPIGGGIATSIDIDTLWIVIEDNVIDSNYVISSKSFGEPTGGGIAIHNYCRIIHNIIKNNMAKNLVHSPWRSAAGGAYVLGWNEYDTSIRKVAIIQNNQFLYNSNNANYATGGGLKVVNMLATCSHNIFIGNRVESDISITDCWGAGMEAYNFYNGSVISGNTFKDNYSEKDDAGVVLFSDNPMFDTLVVEDNYFFNNIAAGPGGALDSYGCLVILQNNVFSGNHAGGSGGAIFLMNPTGVPVDHLATLINNSFYGNTAGSLGGAIFSGNGKPLIFNCIFLQDSAINGQEIYIASGSGEIAWSNIDTDKIAGSYNAGFGIMNEDPRFEDQIYLKPYCFSPCVDKGVYDYTCSHGETYYAPEYDIHGLFRPQGAGVDLGAYDTILCYEGIEDQQSAVGSQQLSVSIFPNPFSDYITFEYELMNQGMVTLTIFNHLGQQVALLVNEQKAQGKHHMQWNAEGLPAGIYYYRLSTNNYRLTTTGKLVIAR